MCEKDHKMLASETLARLISDGGGSVVSACDMCEARFLISYNGPLGLFAEVREIGSNGEMI